MYKFNIEKDENGTWRFELDGINLILDGFFLKNDMHWIKNPSKAIAFFNIGGHLYGVSNEIITYTTVEDFYDNMYKQYTIFTKGLKANQITTPFPLSGNTTPNNLQRSA